MAIFIILDCVAAICCDGIGIIDSFFSKFNSTKVAQTGAPKTARDN